MVGNFIETFINKAAENPLIIIVSVLLFIYAIYIFASNYLKLLGWRKKKMEAEKELEKINKQLGELEESIKSKRDEILKRIKGK